MPTETRSPFKKDYTDENDLIDKMTSDDKFEREETIPAATADDITWKDRYSNLRSHASKVENTLNQKIQELSDRLETVVNKKDATPPEDLEQFKEWIETYPRAQKMFRMLAREENQELEKKIEKTQKEIAKQEKRARLLENIAQIKMRRPEFYGGDSPIHDDIEFRQWLAEKGSTYQKAFQEGEDVDLVIDAIDLFKTQTKWGKSKNRGENASAAHSTRSNSGATPPTSSRSGSYDFTASQVDKMTAREYEAHEANIDKAIKEGRFDYRS